VATLTGISLLLSTLSGTLLEQPTLRHACHQPATPRFDTMPLGKTSRRCSSGALPPAPRHTPHTPLHALALLPTLQTTTTTYHSRHLSLLASFHISFCHTILYPKLPSFAYTPGPSLPHTHTHTFVYGCRLWPSTVWHIHWAPYLPFSTMAAFPHAFHLFSHHTAFPLTPIPIHCLSILTCHMPAACHPHLPSAEPAHF